MVVVGLASLAMGAGDAGWSDAWNALFAFDGSFDQIAVRERRVPRTILGIAGGLALGGAGVLAQTVVGNRLADPGLLGVSSGAGLAVVVAISLLGVTSLAGYIWFALFGAASVALLIFVVGAGRRSMDPVRLLLVGVAVSATATALSSLLLLRDRSSLAQFRRWAVGSLTGRTTDLVLPVLPFLVIGLVLCLAVAGRLDGLALGDDLAEALGVRVRQTRLLAGAAITLCAGAATAAMGPIAFLGLVSAIVARRLVGPDHRWSVPMAMLVGAIVLTGADVVGRLVLRPDEIEVGVVLALLGGPMLIASVRSQRKTTRLGRSSEDAARPTRADAGPDATGTGTARSNGPSAAPSMPGAVAP